jgi:tetratricopeptide (TPR) repeat protein
MKKIILPLTILISLSAFAEEKKIVDPFDLSASASKVKELGVFTKPEVDKLEEKAKELFNSGNCKDAIPVLVEYAKKSNWLANMIAATLNPYYGASYDDKKEYPYAKLKPLIPMESLANDYKKKRNIAYAMHGECLVKIGNKESAIPVLLKALDLIDLDNEIWWQKNSEQSSLGY